MDPNTDTGTRFGIMVDNVIESSKLFIAEQGMYTNTLAVARTWATLEEAFEAAKQEPLAQWEYATVVLIAQPL